MNKVTNEIHFVIACLHMELLLSWMDYGHALLNFCAVFSASTHALLELQVYTKAVTLYTVVKVGGGIARPRSYTTEVTHLGLNHLPVCVIWYSV